MYIVTEAIVLKRVKVSDYDKILTLFTKKAGKMSVSVKGSQNPKSKMASGAHPFVYGEFSINKGGRMSSVTSIDVRESFYKLREDLDKLTIASYFLELANIVIVENVVNNRLFNILLTFLGAMEKASSVEEYHLLKVVFELKLLHTIGLRPEMHSCVNCGNTNIDNPKFSVDDGGVICEDCFNLYPDAYKIGHIIPKLIPFLLDHSLEQIIETDIDNILIKKIEFIINQFLLYHLERKGFKSLKNLGY